MDDSSEMTLAPETTGNPGAEPGQDNENNLTNISPFMSKNLIAAAGFNVETPIVNALIGNLTGTLPTKKHATETIKCEICSCELSSVVVFELHINGSKHRKKLKAMEIISQLRKERGMEVSLGESDIPTNFRCEICLMTLNSAQQLEVHLSGAKHKKRAAARLNPPESHSQVRSNNHSKLDKSSDNAEPSTKRRKTESRLITCDICKVFLNSQTQFEQHILSKKHCHKAKLLNAR